MTETEAPPMATSDGSPNGHSKGAFVAALRAAHQSLTAARDIARIASATGDLHDPPFTATLGEMLARLPELAVEWDEAASPLPASTPDPVLDDWTWVHANMADLARQYSGRHIAVIDRRVVASDRNSMDLDKALEAIPGLDLNRVVMTYLD